MITVVIRTVMMIIINMTIPMINNGNRTEWSGVQFGLYSYERLTKSDDREAGVRFVNHECDYRLQWTTRSPVIN